MKTTSIQNSIRLTKIQVSEINMKSSVDFEKSLTDEVNMELKYSIKFPEGESNNFIIEFNATMTNQDKSFQLETVLLALFKTQNLIDEEFVNSPFVQLNAPAIAFPFLRSFISTISVNAGYNSIIIPSINFANKSE